jgi:hypothetical protein
MDVARVCARIGVALVSSALIGCGNSCDVAKLPTTRETLYSIGQRLSRARSERELAVIASRAELLLAELDWRERQALGYGYLRFRVEEPVSVLVAAPAESVPFWLADQRFRPTGIRLAIRNRLSLARSASASMGWIGSRRLTSSFSLARETAKTANTRSLSSRCTLSTRPHGE